MSYDTELAKEFIRDAFMSGALDLGSSRKFLRGFVEMFSGEMEAAIAVEQATYLSDDERMELLKLAKPTDQTVRDYRAWIARVVKA